MLFLRYSFNSIKELEHHQQRVPGLLPRFSAASWTHGRELPAEPSGAAVCVPGRAVFILRIAGPHRRRPEAPAWAGREAADVLEDMTQHAGRAPLRVRKKNRRRKAALLGYRTPLA